MDETKDMLTRQIETEIQSLATMESGSEEKSTAIEGLTKLYKIKIEEIRTESEIKLKEEEIENQKRDRMIDRIFNVGVRAAEGIGFVAILVIVSYTEYKGGYFGSSMAKLVTKKIR